MQLCDVFLEIGRDGFLQLVRGISIGKLKTYQLYDRIKTRTHVARLNSDNLQKVTPRLWDRLSQQDEEFARDLSQAILVSHLDLIVDVLNFLGVPHEDGFFQKDLDPKPYFTDGWSGRVMEQFQEKYGPALVRFYAGHLAWELHVSQ
jgi:hypothetical protein